MSPLPNDCGGGLACPPSGTYVKRLDQPGPGTRIIDYAEYPDWSPVDDRIVFTKYGSQMVADGENQLQVLVMNADGTGVRQLTHDPTRSARSPEWSPDGKRIVFSGDDMGVPGTPAVGELRVYVMNADGSELAAIPGSEGCPGWPEWSRDGRSIAFACSQDLSRRELSVNVFDISSRTIRRLTGEENAGYPTWSPDSRSIAYVNGAGIGGHAPNDGRIWIMDADGRNQRPLLEPEGVQGARDLQFSPKRGG